MIRVGKTAIESIAAQERSQRERLARLDQRIAAGRAQIAAQVQTLARQRLQCEAVLRDDGVVRHAGQRLSMAEVVLSERCTRLRAAHERVQALSLCVSALDACAQRVKAIERQAGQAALRAEDLHRRFGLTREVPCAGTALQGQCKLLGDARQAQALMPDAQATIARLAGEKLAAQRRLDDLIAQRCTLASRPQALAWAQLRESIARERAARYARMAARAGELGQARARRQEIERELSALGTPGAQTENESTQERAERLDIAAALQALPTIARSPGRGTGGAAIGLRRALARRGAARGIYRTGSG